MAPTKPPFTIRFATSAGPFEISGALSAPPLYTGLSSGPFAVGDSVMLSCGVYAQRQGAPPSPWIACAYCGLTVREPCSRCEGCGAPFPIQAFLGVARLP